MNKNWYRAVVLLIFAGMSIYGETERTASLAWFIAAMVFYAICRIEDVAKYIGESK